MRSSDLAEVLPKLLRRSSFQAHRGRLWEAWIVRHSGAIRRNAFKFYQGSANGMTMSRGRIGRRLLGLAVAGTALAASGAAFAEDLGQPAPWEFRLQASATPVMDSIMRFHDWLLVVITVITLFVLALLVIVVVKFNAKANPVPSKTTHNTLIEVAWTLIPVLIPLNKPFSS